MPVLIVLILWVGAVIAPSLDGIRFRDLLEAGKGLGTLVLFLACFAGVVWGLYGLCAALRHSDPLLMIAVILLVSFMAKEAK